MLLIGNIQVIWVEKSKESVDLNRTLSFLSIIYIINVCISTSLAMHSSSQDSVALRNLH